MTAEPSLADDVERFAANLSATVRAVLGDRDIRFSALVSDDRFQISTPRSEPVTLTVDGEPLLDIRMTYDCDWDGHRRYLAVVKSQIHVLAHGVSQPIFRFEHDRDAHRSIPTSHLQVHAHRDALTWAMTKAGRRTRRASARSRTVTPVPRFEDLHIPLGGRRYRPALEDVLQMIVEEFGVDAADEWRSHLELGRENWRRMQVRASVRDAPSDAASVLLDLGYEVTPPSKRAPKDNIAALRQY